MGYTQLNLLGRLRGLKFGALAAEQILLNLAKLNSDVGGLYSNSMIAVVIYWGMYNNCYAKREDHDFTFEEVVDWVDENQYNDEAANSMASVVKCFEESKASKLLSERIKDVAEKKTQETNGTKSEALSVERPDIQSTTTTA